MAAPGTLGLRTVPGGGLIARSAGQPGWYEAAPPVMWDSSALRPGAAKAVVRAARAAASTAGVGLASDGLGPVSTVSGPAGGARIAGVTARVPAGGRTLSLVPDLRLLASPSTQFPVFIDPTFTYHDVTAGEQAYDPVQSDNGNEGCNTDTGSCDTGTTCTGSHYDSSSYSASPVGYDNFGDGGNCEDNDTDYSLYRVGIPSGSLSSNAVLASASFQIIEVYSSDCSSTATMAAAWIGGISSSTGWPGPNAVSGNKTATSTLGPDAGSCNTVEDTGKKVATGLDVTADLNAIGDSATNITFRVWEADSPGDDLHKQLTLNPTLEVIWINKPSTPSNLEEAATNGGAGSLDCGTSPSSAPHIGKTDSVSGVWLIGTFGDSDNVSVNGNVEYKNYTTSSAWTVKDSAFPTVASGKPGGYQLPSSVTSSLSDGTVIEWAAQASGGTGTIGGTTYGPYTSAWTKPCYFAVYPDAPDAPTLAANFTQTTAQTIGSSVSFKITQSSGDTASKFVWAIDQTPQTTGTIPAVQTCTTSAATADCTKIASGSATLTIPVPAPGPHDLWVYEVDSGGNDSGMTNGAPSGQSSTFEGAGDLPVSYTDESSLQANFDAALDAGKSYDNTMISTEAGLPGTADADGHGNALDEAELKAAGWNPSTATVASTVTIDGATFTLPKFGASTSGPDNLLAANQTIGTGASGAQGSALVVLATSTDANVQVPGLVASGSPDSGALASDFTAPSTPGGSPVTGAGCSYQIVFDTNASCVPASGTINYSGTCPSAINNQVPLTLTVPDWVNGPYDIAALTMPDRDHPGAQQALNPNPYVFAVPLNPSCTVASVTLPDVGASVSGPALHILGITLRNTTTATPEVGGAMPASPSQQAWTGAFESPIENAFTPPSGKTWGDQTVRIALTPSVSAAAGSDIRIRLSDPGYWSEDGTGPLKVGAASIAQQSSGAAAVQAPEPLLFEGAASVTVPEGGDIYSDPFTLPVAITAGQPLLVSLWLENASLSLLPLNSFPSGAMSWFAPTGTPNETAVQAGTVFTSGGGYATSTVPLLTGLDVTTPAVAGQSPGEPTVVVTGNDGIVDGEANAIPSDAGNAPSQRLAGQLESQGDASGYGVVDGSVESNMVLFDGPTQDADTPPGGIALQYRFDHDVLAEPDLGSVIIDVGLQDVLWLDGDPSSTSLVADAIDDVVQQLVSAQLSAYGGIVVGTLTPCHGYDNATITDVCDSQVDVGRTQVNDNLSGLGAICETDFDGALTAAGSSPETLASAYDDGDHANLTLGASGGYAKLAQEETGCGVAPPLYAAPSTP